MEFDKYSMPFGLPGRFSESRQGLDHLQQLLKVPNRKAWRGILDMGVVREVLDRAKPNLRGLKTSRRLVRNVVTYYSDPDERRETFDLWLNSHADDFAQAELLAPSIEFEALTQYSPELADKRLASRESIEESTSGIAEVLDLPVHYLLPTHAFAYMAWCEIRSDINRWDSLTRVRRNMVSLGVFSVATILDDVRFLRWAAEQVEELAGEYSFALKEAEPGPAVSVPGPEPSFPPLDRVDVLADWQRTCDAVIEVANRLRRGISELEGLQDLLEPVRRLESMGPSVVARQQAELRSRLLDQVMEDIVKCAAEHGTDWVKGIAVQLRAQWHLAYLSTTGEEEIQAGRVRLNQNLGALLQEWSEAERLKLSRRHELASLRSSRGAGLEACMAAEAQEAKVHGGLLNAITSATRARERILQLVGPGDSAFDPSRDYLREWMGLVGSKSHQVEVVPPDGSLGGKSLSTDRDDPTTASRGGPAVPDPFPDADRNDRNSEPPGSGGGGGWSSAPGPAEGREKASPRPAAIPSATGGHGVSQSRRLEAEAPHATPSVAVRPERAAPEPHGGRWQEWLAMIGDPHRDRTVPSLAPEHSPQCHAGSRIPMPDSFAPALVDKLERGLLSPAGDALSCIARFVVSDPQKGRPEWKPVYMAILEYCISGRLDSEDSRAIAFPMLLAMLHSQPSKDEYQDLVDVSGRLTQRSPSPQNLNWSLDLADGFLSNGIPERECLAPFLHRILTLIDEAKHHLSAQRQQVATRAQNLLSHMDWQPMDDAGDSHSALSGALQGKRLVIYTLRRSSAVTVRNWIRHIQPSTEVELLNNRVWSDSLLNPVRNADLLVMVTAAATHAATEMISRTRRAVGKDVIVPASMGSTSMKRAICRALGILDPELVWRSAPLQAPA